MLARPAESCCRTSERPTPILSSRCVCLIFIFTFLLSHLKIYHLNVRSLLSNMDMARIWVKSRGAEIVADENISITGYNVYRTDRPKRAGGVAINVKSRFDTLIALKCTKHVERIPSVSCSSLVVISRRTLPYFAGYKSILSKTARIYGKKHI